MGEKKQFIYAIIIIKQVVFAEYKLGYIRWTGHTSRRRSGGLAEFASVVPR